MNKFLLFYQIMMTFFVVMFTLDVTLIGTSPATYAWPICFAYYYMQYQNAKLHYRSMSDEDRND